MKDHIEKDKDTFNAPAYKVKGQPGVAWHVLGWETAPDKDTEWTGQEERTGRVVAVMVGDDHHETFSPEDLEPIKRRDYCGSCGQIGCGHDGLDRDEEDGDDDD